MPSKKKKKKKSNHEMNKKEKGNKKNPFAQQRKKNGNVAKISNGQQFALECLQEPSNSRHAEVEKWNLAIPGHE
jgi:hypothetical protein